MGEWEVAPDEVAIHPLWLEDGRNLGMKDLQKGRTTWGFGFNSLRAVCPTSGDNMWRINLVEYKRKNHNHNSISIPVDLHPKLCPKGALLGYGLYIHKKNQYLLFIYIDGIEKHFLAVLDFLNNSCTWCKKLSISGHIPKVPLNYPYPFQYLILLHQFSAISSILNLKPYLFLAHAKYSYNLIKYKILYKQTDIYSYYTYNIYHVKGII